MCAKKISTGSFENVVNKICLEIIYFIYMYKKDLALNSLQWLICHKTKPNQISHHIAYTFYSPVYCQFLLLCIVNFCLYHFLGYLSLLLLLLGFQFYFQFLTIHFTLDLGWGKVAIVCIHAFCCNLGNVFQSHWQYSLQEMNSFAKCNFLYFILAGTASYLITVLIFPFLDYTQSSNCYWLSNYFKVPHLLNFYF